MHMHIHAPKHKWKHTCLHEQIIQKSFISAKNSVPWTKQWFWVRCLHKFFGSLGHSGKRHLFLLFSLTRQEEERFYWWASAKEEQTWKGPLPSWHLSSLDSNLQNSEQKYGLPARAFIQLVKIAAESVKLSLAHLGSGLAEPQDPCSELAPPLWFHWVTHWLFAHTRSGVSSEHWSVPLLCRGWALLPLPQSFALSAIHRWCSL